MGNKVGSKRGKYILKVINKGCFKNQGKKAKANCLICEKEFNYYLSQRDKKYCSLNCYHISHRGKKRPEHSLFMKKFNEAHPEMGKHFIGRIQSEKERENTSKRMIERWKDKNDKLNSEEYKQKLSDRNIALAKLGKGISTFNKGYARGRQGHYNINGKDIFFRSLWEANYALYLDFLIKQKQIKSWEFEPETFWFEKIKRGIRSYLPDFKVININNNIEYHEVKGWMDDKSKTKLKRMAKYYPKIKMVLIDSNVYKELKKKLGRVIGFYE